MVLEVASLTNENFQNELQESASKKDWKNILKISKRYGSQISSIVWVYPSEHCLQQLKVTFKNLNITNILSIGCGIGLLEFLIRESVGVKMSGLEIDSKYWGRKKPFIPLKLVEHGQEISPNTLLDSCLSKNWNFALLFCYFNNRRAFNEYINLYKGNYVIIIGPGENTGRYTDPLPLDFKDNEDFQLIHLSDFGDNRDLIAIYERKDKKFAV